MWRKLRLWLLGLLGLVAVSEGTGLTTIHAFMPGIAVPGGFFGATNLSVTFIGCTADTSDATVYTYTDHATGTADANRTTIIGVMAEDSATNFEVSSMTVGGSAATERFDQSNISFAIEQAVYVFANPTGTTATIEVTFSEAITGSTICVWAASNLSATTAIASNSDSSTTGLDAGDLTLSGHAGGAAIVIGIGIDAASTAAWAWTGPTERADAAAGAEFRYTAADATVSADPYSITIDSTGAGQGMGLAIAFR